MLDAGLVLYVGLLVLFLWRWLSGWRLCGAWLEYANYCVLLYTLLLVLLLYSVVLYLRAMCGAGGHAAWADLPGWMRPMMIAAPCAACIAYAMCASQTMQHVGEIRRGAATLRHDRAVQIIALPAVYGVMAMSALTRMYQFKTGSHEDAGSLSGLTPEELRELYLSKSETCFWVGDLYEAWALYQFGQLTLQLIRSSVHKMRNSEVRERREAAQALAKAHSAVESIAWLGISLFLVVCVLQSGWSCYLLTFTAPITDFSQYNARMAQFSAAGMVASAGAIYNVHVVESTFHEYLEGYRPLLKFITVKIIVSFAFFQRGAINMFSAFQATLPGMMRGVVRRVPMLGDIINMDQVSFNLFYSSLILLECILIAALHGLAWRASEPWYADTETDGVADGTAEKGEKTPLLAKAERGDASSGV
mmetsp:Transcript_42354/g.112070  ORF Transcript_42354/g.112070 Transcript_42354/m.112070 type:complete len:419 (-) Transcript_42354:17-1273(-)